MATAIRLRPHVGSSFSPFRKSCIKKEREEPADTVITQVGHVHTATLYCKTNSQDNSTITTWYKDDVNVEEGSLPFYNITKESLVVQTTDINDPGAILEGLYYCVINNGTPTVSATSRSPTIAATSPSMPKSTDYVTTSQSTPRASSTSISSSYATSPSVQSTTGTKSPRVTSTPATVTQVNASSVSLSSSSSTLNLPTTSTPRTNSSSQRSDLIPTTSTVLPTSQTASSPSHHTNTPSLSGMPLLIML
ncbi:uncharacterized protein LOC134188625 [Corticium candelabrum]|uniref:uncharacterized protein LOC134188625 n=1 Tax=Corticium candelabrum TaxID=121492 RepID=UPI002E269484|nr:uncharacterized protein LOC134188625 [Corticium candelabrum]